MNSKQLIVALLFLITLCIGGFTIYLLVQFSNQTNQINVTPTPLPISQTPSPTPTLGPEVVCGLACTRARCTAGSTCITVNTTKRCVANACITNESGTPTINNACNTDLCTLKATVNISKKAEISCDTNNVGGNKVKLIITLTNSSDTAFENLIVTDDLTNSISLDYLNEDSISNNGSVSNSRVVWSDISLAAVNGAIELSYELNVPAAENGKTYVNPVVVTSNNTIIGNSNFSLTIDILPCTALNGDQVALITGGAMLILLGMMYISRNYDVKVGNFLWGHGLGKVLLPVGKIAKKMKKETILTIKEKKGHKNAKFEDKLINNKDNN